MKESLLSPKPKERQSRLNTGSCSHMGWAGASTGWTTGAWDAGLMAWQLRVLATSWAWWGQCGPAAPEAALLPQETELSHLVVAETSGLVHLRAVLRFASHKSCHYTSNPPMHISLRCISCDTVEESYFLQKHFYYYTNIC